jgi:MOSC domain-containing protein YiiM
VLDAGAIRGCYTRVLYAGARRGCYTRVLYAGAIRGCYTLDVLEPVVTVRTVGCLAELALVNRDLGSNRT